MARENTVPQNPPQLRLWRVDRVMWRVAECCHVEFFVVGVEGLCGGVGVVK